jgi:hypothetical protein
VKENLLDYKYSWAIDIGEILKKRILKRKFGMKAMKGEIIDS